MSENDTLLLSFFIKFTCHETYTRGLTHPSHGFTWRGDFSAQRLNNHSKQVFV